MTCNKLPWVLADTGLNVFNRGISQEIPGKIRLAPGNVITAGPPVLSGADFIHLTTSTVATGKQLLSISSIPSSSTHCESFCNSARMA